MLGDELAAAAIDAFDSEVAILDGEGVIVYTNERWQQFAQEGGFPDEPSMVGTNYVEAYESSRENRDEYADRATRGVRSLLDGTDARFTMEYPCSTPTEPSAWYLLWASTFAFEGDRYVLLEHIDITDRRRMERQVRDRNERLSTVSSVLSHDLRSPMSVAMGYAEMLKDDPTAAHAEEIIVSLRRMDAIIDDAVTLSRQDLGDIETVDLEAVVEAAWGLIETADASLTVVDSFSFEADRSILVTVFQNCFRNAIEHAGSDVAMRVGPLATDRGFFVEDDGPGIPPAERDAVFDSGYTTQSVEGNSGLGLTIVQTAIALHGWEITVTDAATGGARFEVRLPEP